MKRSDFSILGQSASANLDTTCPLPGAVDVLFVDLPFNSYELGRRFKSAWSFKQFLNAYELHLGFRYMAAYLRHRGFRADILYPSRANGLTTKGALLKAICEAPPAILGFTSYEGSVRESFEFIRRIKAKGVPSLICMGGHLATFSYAEILRDFPALVDVIVLGDGEEAIVEVAEAVTSGRGFEHIPGLAYLRDGETVTTPRRPIEPKIDRYPFPILDTPKWQGSAVPLFLTTSRGCYGHCSFCRSSHFGERWRAREPGNVVDEIEVAVARGVSIFEMVDDNFLGPGKVGRERAMAVASEIKRRGLRIQFHISCRVNDVDEPTMVALKDAGLISVSLGVESGVQRILDTLNKGITVQQSLDALELLRRVGLPAFTYVIFFDPYVTLDEALENIHFLQHIRALGNVRFEEILFRRLIPISGTDIFERIRRDGLLRGDYLKGHRFVFKDARVSWLADFLETIDLRFERLMRRDEFRGLGNLYDVKEVLEFAFAEQAIDMLRFAGLKKTQAMAAMEEVLSEQLHRLFLPKGITPVSPLKGELQHA